MHSCPGSVLRIFSHKIEAIFQISEKCTIPVKNRNVSGGGQPLGNMQCIKNACLSWVIWITSCLFTCTPSHLPPRENLEKICSTPCLVGQEWNKRSAYHLGNCLDIRDFSGSCLPQSHILQEEKNVCLANSSQHCCKEFAKQVFECSKCSSACFLFFDEKTLGSSEELEFTFHGY